MPSEPPVAQKKLSMESVMLFSYVSTAAEVAFFIWLIIALPSHGPISPVIDGLRRIGCENPFLNEFCSGPLTSPIAVVLPVIYTISLLCACVTIAVTLTSFRSWGASSIIKKLRSGLSARGVGDKKQIIAFSCAIVVGVYWASLVQSATDCGPGGRPPFGSLTAICADGSALQAGKIPLEFWYLKIAVVMTCSLLSAQREAELLK